MENSKQITIRYVAYFWHFFKSSHSPLHIPYLLCIFILIIIISSMTCSFQELSLEQPLRFLLQNKLREESALYYLYKHVLFLTHFAVLNLVDVRVFNMAHSSQRIVVPFAAVRLIVLRAINPKSSDAGHGPQPKDSFLCYQSRSSVLSPSLKSGWLISFQFLYSCISSLAKHGHHSLPLFQQWLQTQYHFLQRYAIIVVITIYLYYNSTHDVISAFQVQRKPQTPLPKMEEPYRDFLLQQDFQSQGAQIHINYNGFVLNNRQLQHFLHYGCCHL